MSAHRAFTSSLVLIFGLAAAEVQAESVRCGSHLIRDGGSHGATMYEVLKKCGEPDSRTGYTWRYKLNGRLWEMRFDGNGYLLILKRVEKHGISKY